MPQEGTNLMQQSLASLFAAKFLATVYGRAIDINVGDSDALISVLGGGEKNSKLNLVDVKHVQLNGSCFNTPLLLLLPGDGEELTADDVFCGRDTSLRKWSILPDRKLPALHVGSVELAQFGHKKEVEIKEVRIVFGEIRLVGSVIRSVVSIRWTENILGHNITLLDAVYPIEFDFNVENPYRIHLADVSGPFGIPISVDAEISLHLNPNQICGDLRASWIGGNVGARACQGF